MALTKIGKEGITGISNSSDANAITIDSSENVGIGTASPSKPLTVVGGDFNTVLLDNSNSSHGTQILFQANGATNSGADIQMSDAGGLKIRTLAVEPLTFHTSASAGSPSERLRILTSGGITFNGDTAAANALDDYEEGTFTPRFQMGLTSPGYSQQQGNYVKIGSLVVCSIYFRANSGTENGDHIYVGGLPFTSMTGIDHQFGAFFTYNGGFWNSDANTQWLALQNQTNLAFYKQSDGGAIQGTTSGVATNLNADLRLVAVYRST